MQVSGRSRHEKSVSFGDVRDANSVITDMEKINDDGKSIQQPNYVT